MVSRRGRADIQLDGTDVIYRPEPGRDPFGYSKLPERMSRAELLALTAESDYPDAPLQVAQVFDSPRAGDFIVSAVPGYDLRVRNERVEHRSCHGSLHREHMRVPFAINRPIAARQPRTVDVFNTILRHMGEAALPGLQSQRPGDSAQHRGALLVDGRDLTDV